MYRTGFSIHKWILSPILTFKLIRFDLKQSSIKYSPDCQADEMIILSEISFNFTLCHEVIRNNIYLFIYQKNLEWAKTEFVTSAGGADASPEFNYEPWDSKYTL